MFPSVISGLTGHISGKMQGKCSVRTVSGPSVKTRTKSETEAYWSPPGSGRKTNISEMSHSWKLTAVGAGALKTHWCSTQSGSIIGQGLGEAGWKSTHTNLQRWSQIKPSKHMCYDSCPKAVQNHSRPAQNKLKMNPQAQISHVEAPEPTQNPIYFPSVISDLFKKD